MNLRNIFVEWLASRLQVPADALEMFKAANRLSGLSRQTLPTELIPLNTRQLAQGLLNFTVFQNSPGWVLPYWAERQYDHADTAFVPRSHLGLSLNITHRNWTAVGNPDCPVEPIVDPRGLLTPRPGSWSLDVWLVAGGKAVFPSRLAQIHQQLMNGMPVVLTVFQHRGVRLECQSYTLGQRLYQKISVLNAGGRNTTCRVALAVRPYNPEGVSLIRNLRYDMGTQAMIVNGTDRVELSEPPDGVRLSTRLGGDSSQFLPGRQPPPLDSSVVCPDGLANGFVSFDVELGRRSSWSIISSCPLDIVPENSHDHNRVQPEQAIEVWEKRLSAGADIRVPDHALCEAVNMARATLMMLTDGSSITPGPSIYHQFWFRDAAYMVWALDRLGLSSYTRRLVESYPDRQRSSGYFRSQQGEWDSNGQAIWTVWQHALLTGNRKILESSFESMHHGASWIARNRVKVQTKAGRVQAGLLPPGFSAEHLGLSDQYFWDNFWSIAGLDAFLRVCRILNRKSEMAMTEALLVEFRMEVERAMAQAQTRLGTGAIPAAPLRDLDSGMIGSIVAGYPLQLLKPKDPRLASTLSAIEERFFVDGMYYHQFIHSGLNAYLTLQIAHAWLYAGNRTRFWSILQTVLRHATPTWTFPEAIHPNTGGGSMGDGHHGWAAAELALAVGDAFVSEFWRPEQVLPELVLLSGVPGFWFRDPGGFSISRAPVSSGLIDVSVHRVRRKATISIGYEPGGLLPSGPLKVVLPFRSNDLRVNGKEGRSSENDSGETVIAVSSPPTEVEIVVTLPRHF